MPKILGKSRYMHAGGGGHPAYPVVGQRPTMTRRPQPQERVSVKESAKRRIKLARS